MSALGVDPARGGADKTVLAPRYRNWFAPLAKYAGTATPDGPHVVGLIVTALELQRCPAQWGTTVHIDVIGIGASVYDGCVETGLNASPVHFGESTDQRDVSGQLSFANKRAHAYWTMREYLDPARGLDMELPPDPELLADLAAPRWCLQAGRIKIESKV